MGSFSGGVSCIESHIHKCPDPEFCASLSETDPVLCTDVPQRYAAEELHLGVPKFFNTEVVGLHLVHETALGGVTLAAHTHEIPLACLRFDPLIFRFTMQSVQFSGHQGRNCPGLPGSAQAPPKFVPKSFGVVGSTRFWWCLGSLVQGWCLSSLGLVD